MKSLLGGKGANLAEMSAIGLPVPPGFTICTKVCQSYDDSGGKWPPNLGGEVDRGIAHIEASMNQGFGDTTNPLLVSVRSGAAVSMPGMMDTVLNLGINDDVVAGLIESTGNPRFAYDAYRRFIDMFGGVVMGVPHQAFEDAMTALKNSRGVTSDLDLSGDDLKQLVDEYKDVYKNHVGTHFPEGAREQLRLAINAVLNSWNSDRAVKYREIHQITGLIGTAVNVQAMVFGDLNNNSGTGVCFTRNPATGEPGLFGEFLINAQGEDVVAGIRTPSHISFLEEAIPGPFNELTKWAHKLESHYRDVQDMEFTIQDGELFILQTRSGKRTGHAAIKIAVDLVHEGMISKKEAVQQLVTPKHLDSLLHPRFADEGDYSDHVIAEGLPASPGAAVGQVVFHAADAEEFDRLGIPSILVRHETSPEDIGGMYASQGILTSRGGMTSHAAVVARGWGKPCIVGCSSIHVDYESESFHTNGLSVKKGDWISLNGETGEIISGRQDVQDVEPDNNAQLFLSWVDEVRDMNVRANADTPADAENALKLGATGIGLCRTEHMFFEGKRITAMREMIIAANRAERDAALAKLLPFQKEDFKAIFKVMDGFPVTIRLLDPPLHEFLPHDTEGMEEMARNLSVDVELVSDKVEHLGELNPMLGHRGCRLGVLYPEITEMQARAILEAAVEAELDSITVTPEIMIPLVGTVEEFRHQRSVIEETAEKVFSEKGHRVHFLVGTMIEIPRAALIADRIAAEADFFSFGTNDLTQLTFGYSRDDAGKFLPYYVDHEFLASDPFQSIDIDGVGSLIKTAVGLARSVKPDIKLGVCGEHGGDPASVHFCHSIGLTYVSCSPFRIPIARLAAAQVTR